MTIPPKILTFRICREGFQKLINGEVENKFREATPYWESRLLEKNGGYKQFDAVEIINGYSKDSPKATVEFLGISPTTNNEGKIGFEIKLGKILEIV